MIMRSLMIQLMRMSDSDGVIAAVMIRCVIMIILIRTMIIMI